MDAHDLGRKFNTECQVCNQEWAAKYLITNVCSKAVCVICQMHCGAVPPELPHRIFSVSKLFLLTFLGGGVTVLEFLLKFFIFAVCNKWELAGHFSEHIICFVHPKIKSSTKEIHYSHYDYLKNCVMSREQLF